MAIEREIKITAAEADKTAKDIKKVAGSLDEVGAAAKKTGKSSQSLGAQTASLAKGFAVFGLAVEGAKKALAGLKAVFDAAKAGAAAKDLADAFRALGGTAKDLDKLNVAFNRTLSTAEIQKLHNVAVAIGLTSQQFTELSKVAKAASSVMGIDAAEAVKKLAGGVQKLSREELLQVGIVLDMKKAYEDHAKTLGTTAAKLTETEKRTAILNATLEAGKKLIAIDPGSSEDAYSELAKHVGDATTELKMFLDTVVRPFILALNEIITNFKWFVDQYGPALRILNAGFAAAGGGAVAGGAALGGGGLFGPRVEFGGFGALRELRDWKNYVIKTVKDLLVETAAAAKDKETEDVKTRRAKPSPIDWEQIELSSRLAAELDQYRADLRAGEAVGADIQRRYQQRIALPQEIRELSNVWATLWAEIRTVGAALQSPALKQLGIVPGRSAAYMALRIDPIDEVRQKAQQEAYRKGQQYPAATRYIAPTERFLLEAEEISERGGEKYRTQREEARRIQGDAVTEFTPFNFMMDENREAAQNFGTAMDDTKVLVITAANLMDDAFKNMAAGIGGSFAEAIASGDNLKEVMNNMMGSIFANLSALAFQYSLIFAAMALAGPALVAIGITPLAAGNAAAASVALAAIGVGLAVAARATGYGADKKSKRPKKGAPRAASQRDFIGPRKGAEKEGPITILIDMDGTRVAQALVRTADRAARGSRTLATARAG